MWGDLLSPENVAAAVAFLLSDECPVNGEMIQAGGSHVGRTFFAQTRGWTADTPLLTPEQVRDHFEEVCDPKGYTIPLDARDAMNQLKTAVLG